MILQVRHAAIVVSFAFTAGMSACSSDDSPVTAPPPPDVANDGGTPDALTRDSEADSASVVDSGSDSGTDAGELFSEEAKKLLAALGDTTWHGSGTRNGKARALELRFRGSSLQWAEIVNPYGPSRRRELRSFIIEDDAKTIVATANTPLSWKDRTDATGPKSYAVKLKPGSPRTLEVTRDGTTEVFTEGEFPKPAGGLTARVRAFPAGAIEDAFCKAGSGFDYPTFLNFARGKSGTALAEDIVAGAKLNAWVDSSGLNRFSVTDVDGFKNAGGTDLSDNFNFFVQYTGFINHPGGDFTMRERDDSVEDGVWAFLGPKVGSVNTNDIFLEVHGFPFADKTEDTPDTAMAKGKVPIEIIVARCAKPIENIHVEIAFHFVDFQLVSTVSSEPLVNDTLFPPAL